MPLVTERYGESQAHPIFSGRGEAPAPVTAWYTILDTPSPAALAELSAEHLIGRALHAAFWFTHLMSKMRPLAGIVLSLILLLAALLCSCARTALHYGSNPAAGKTFVHDGVQLYYEVYGSGEPLLLAHMNGGSIGTFKAQIDDFRQHYQVIAMDSRDHGKSGDSAGKITYEKMADDLAALLDHLQTGPANVLGWSDGGIEALLLAMRHPQKVRKIVAMAANLNPSEQAVRPEIIAFTRSAMDAIPAASRETPQGKRDWKVMQLLFDEPHIDPASLAAITAPALILASDHDLIQDEHTLEIYHHIPNSQLRIFPNATHMIPYDDPALFNATVERFLHEPFAKKDRVQDFFKSFQAMQTEISPK
jgi:pimeloyl-ACP methyl ester carboxylesterase